MCVSDYDVRVLLLEVVMILDMSVLSGGLLWFACVLLLLSQTVVLLVGW